MSGAAALTMHGTAFVLGPGAVLVRGPARVGKSSLCLAALNRGLSAGLTAALVADDGVIATRENGALRLSGPATIAGLIEVSGAGLLRLPFTDDARLAMIVDLRPQEAIPRLPEKTTTALLGVDVPRIFLPERQASFGADILLALALRDFRLEL